MKHTKDVILAHWEAYGYNWPKGLPSFRVHVRKPMRIEVVGSNAVAAELDILEFTKDYGYYDGAPAVRILCEGVCVDARRENGSSIPALIGEEV